MPIRAKFVAVASLLFALIAFPLASPAADNAFVRINQLGYLTGSPARAYLMSKGTETGATFQVLNAKGIASSTAPIGAILGVWGNFNVFALDFTPPSAGTFTIEVNGPMPATSPAFTVGTGKKLYAQALANSLYFYQNERDGQNYIPTPLRTAPGHLNDKSLTPYAVPQFDDDDNILGSLQPVGSPIDASGGWWDAGDYLKFVQTHSYTVALMLIGVRDFPQQMGAAGNSDFTAEAKFGLQWLTKMWDDNSQTLYYQVGIGTDFADSPKLLSDHDVWRLPQVDDTLGGTDPSLQYIRNRPVFQAGPAGSPISPNLAGRLTADFAACYQVFHKTNPAFANQCLISAEHIFALANTNPTGDLLTVSPFDFYGESEWRDDMELGATELYFALANADGPLPAAVKQTNPNFYLKAAAHWANAYITGPCDACDTLNLYDVSGLAHFELFRAISEAGKPSGLEVSQKDLVKDIKKELQNAQTTAATDPFGFGFPWAAYDTATHGAGLSVMAKEYALLTDSNKFENLSHGWAGNILGANAWGSSFIVGDGEVFPDCMQHQVANIVGSLDGTPPILAGALVEGPNTFAARGLLDGMVVCPADGVNVYKKFNGNGSVYKDDEQSYSTVEPAIDLTAGSFLMFAWQIAGQPATLCPTADFSPSLDQAVTATPNSKWPPLRANTRRYNKDTVDPD
jgi:endoglucanase